MTIASRQGKVAWGLAAVCLTLPSSAFAGGFEIPDLGTEALGRGGAFVAKADDPTAIYYNPAGLARQRGTHLLVNGNIYLHSFTFQRAGRFPDDPKNPVTPWGREPFAPVSNTGGAYVAPFVALTTDFGTFDRLTAAVGVYTPPTVANRNFRAVENSEPSASRYDFMHGQGSYLYPTASVAYRVLPWLDVGVSGHLVLAQFGTTWMSYADQGQCPNQQFQPCDSRTAIDASATGIAGTLGVLARPTKNVAIGATFHTPASLAASGTLTAATPVGFNGKFPTSDATLYSSLPLTARLGARYVSMNGTFEVYDLELDGTYEAWSAAQGDGVRIIVPSFGSLKKLDMGILRGYGDTMGIRAGGAYNFDAFGGVLSLRGGGYFDSSATAFATTRVDYDTLAKIAGTFGLGYTSGPLSVNIAYAAVASMPRVVGVGDGRIRPLNIARGGSTTANNGDRLDAVNNGAYRGFTHIFSLGLTVAFDEVWGFARKSHYGNAYEPGYGGPAAPEPKAEPEERPASDEEEAPKPTEESSKPTEEAPKKHKFNPDDPWS